MVIFPFGFYFLSTLTLLEKEGTDLLFMVAIIRTFKSYWQNTFFCSV